MKILKGGLPCIIICLFLLTNLTAQKEIPTLEDLYLSTEIEIQLIRSQAVSDNRSNKLESLTIIREMLEDGRVSANENAILTVLDSLSAEGVRKLLRSDGRVSNNFPEVRRQAVYLLGDIGGARAQNILYSVLRDEPETMVLSEAVLALGRSGSSDERTALYLADILQDNTASTTPDNNLAYACLLAIQDLGVVNINVLTEVINVATGSYLIKSDSKHWTYSLR